MVKHCCWGNCRSDDRYKDKKYMHGVFFIPFPKPVTQLDKCKTWVSLCGRKNWSVANVNKHTYICSRHFIGGNGPTADHPNPVPASGTAIEKRRAEKRARPYPRQRSSVPVTNKCRYKQLTDKCMYILCIAYTVRNYICNCTCSEVAFSVPCKL